MIAAPRPGRRRWAALLAASGLALASRSATAQPNYQALQPNVVKIVAYHGEAFETGAGIIAGAMDGGVDILTDLHVVAPLTGSPGRPDPPSKIEVFFARDRLTPIAATWTGSFDDSLDLTAVRVMNGAVARQSETLSDVCVAPQDPKDSDVVTVIGHGAQDWQTLVNLNAVLAARADTDYKTFFISTMGLDRGFSGGPVFSAAGCLVGIVRQLSSRQASVTNIHDALRSAVALGIHTDVFRGAAPIDTTAKAAAYSELAKVLTTYLFNVGQVVAVYGQTGRRDLSQLAQTNGQYNDSYTSLFNDRGRYRLSISMFWNERRVQPFDSLLDDLDRFHKELIFSRLDQFVKVLRSKPTLSSTEQRDLTAVIDDMRARLPSLQQKTDVFIADLQR